MIILTEGEESQDLKFIPREYNADSIIVTNEQTGVSSVVSVQFSKVGYYLSGSVSLSLYKDNFYNLKVLNGENVVYRDKIFCTSQQDYSINKDEYIQNNTENEYTVYNG